MVISPLIKIDHPKIDDSAFLEENGIQHNQLLIRQLQWLISLGKFDILATIMTMLVFRSTPREGHFDRVQRIHGYLPKKKHSVIRICTEELDYSDIPMKENDWEFSV